MYCFFIPIEDITLPADGVLRHDNLQPHVSQVSGHTEHIEAAAMLGCGTSADVGPADALEEVVSDVDLIIIKHLISLE